MNIPLSGSVSSDFIQKKKAEGWSLQEVEVLGKTWLTFEKQNQAKQTETLRICNLWSKETGNPCKYQTNSTLPQYLEHYSTTPHLEASKSSVIQEHSSGNPLFYSKIIIHPLG
jgi:hypothetical protein